MASYLPDTNLLLRSVQANHPMHPAATRSMATPLAQGHTLFLVPQNLYEFWVVATRPIAGNGLGWTTEQADVEITRLESFLTLLPDGAGTYTGWRELVLTHNVTGVPAHDARLVAAMQMHNLTHLLTFNVSDFRRYQSITVVEPAQVIASEQTGDETTGDVRGEEPGTEEGN